MPVENHTRILEAVERRDPEEARRAMLHHLEVARGDLVRSGRERRPRRRARG